jgi:hypothetical protein
VWRHVSPRANEWRSWHNDRIYRYSLCNYRAEKTVTAIITKCSVFVSLREGIHFILDWYEFGTKNTMIMKELNERVGLTGFCPSWHVNINQFVETVHWSWCPLALYPPFILTEGETTGRLINQWQVCVNSLWRRRYKFPCRSGRDKETGGSVTNIWESFKCRHTCEPEPTSHVNYKERQTYGNIRGGDRQTSFVPCHWRPHAAWTGPKDTFVKVFL